MNTNEKGNIGLAKLLMFFTGKEYSCYLPFTDTTCVDLIVSNKKMDLKKIQIKYRKIDKRGCIEVQFSTKVNGKTVFVDKSQLDYYCIYCPDNEKIYFIDLKEKEYGKTLTLRVNTSKYNIKKTNNANDFLTLNF